MPFNQNLSIKNIFQVKYVLGTAVILIAIFISKYIAQGNIKYVLLLIFPLFLLIILIKPLIGLIISLPLVLYFSYIDFLWVSLWNYVLLFLVFVALLALLLKGKIKLNQFSQKILIIFILYILLSTFINWVQGVSPKIFLYDDVVLISTLLLGFCTMFFTKNEKQLKIFIYCLIGFISISALVGIMQFIGIDFFWKLREILGVNPSIALNISSRNRIPGLSSYNISLGYELVSIIPLIYGILILKKKKKLTKYYLLTTFMICLLALLMTKSRSAIIGGIIGLIIITFWGFKSKIRSKKNLSSLVIILIIIISILVSFPSKLSTYRFAFRDTSSLTRISALIISEKVFFNHPFGTGRPNKYYNQYSDEFKKLTYKYVRKYAPLRLSELPYLLKSQLIIAPHNYFINILLYYGIFGFLLLILFYYYIFKGLSCVFKNNREKSFIKSITLGLIGSFTAYIINSLFHNGGPFLLDPINWYFIGMTLSLLNHYGKPKKIIQ